MTVKESNQMHKKMACLQFIAEVSLIANCKPSDLKLALTLIADLANADKGLETYDEPSYAGD
jgi:hypothetical protein